MLVSDGNKDGKGLVIWFVRMGVKWLLATSKIVESESNVEIFRENSMSPPNSVHRIIGRKVGGT